MKLDVRVLPLDPETNGEVNHWYCPKLERTFCGLDASRMDEVVDGIDCMVCNELVYLNVLCPDGSECKECPE